jgi:pimeloyl-ACP methyl ester carboxylesterase/DNA-binding CsgD family transcriptional regulator
MRAARRFRLDSGMAFAMPASQQIRFCTSADGVRIAYASSGSGPPLVKVGTWMTHVELDWESSVWRPMLRELSRDHTFIRYDARGCGLSDREVEDISVEAWVRDLEAVADAAGIARFPLLGYSQGGAIAIAYAARHPERVSHLVLHGAFARGRLARAPSPQEREDAETMIKLAEIGWGKDDPAYRQFFTTQFIPDSTLEQQRWWNELQRATISPANAARFMRATSLIDVTGLAPRVSCPTLVMHSKSEMRIPLEEGRLIAALIPGARFVPLESRNHVLLEHEPAWERWLEAVRDFLPAATPGGAPFSALTPREAELVELIAQGLDNAQIAARLDLSDKTVRNHITSIFAKLGVDNRARAIVLAREAGFGQKAS